MELRNRSTLLTSYTLMLRVWSECLGSCKEAAFLLESCMVDIYVYVLSKQVTTVQDGLAKSASGIFQKIVEKYSVPGDVGRKASVVIFGP